MWLRKENSGGGRRCLLLFSLLLLLVLMPSWSLEAAHAGIVPDFITDNIVDVQVVCPPDSMVCPNGGRAFRDKHHDCKFTPCEFVAAVTAAATPPPGMLRTLNASVWFRNEEFVVPRLAFRDLKRGKRISERVARVLRHKSQRALAWARVFAFAATLDIVSVPVRRSDQSQYRSGAPDTVDEDRIKAHDHILNEALSTGGDVALAQQGTLLVAARKPPVRFAFFGYLARHPTPANVRRMVALVQDAHSLATAVREKPSNATSTETFFADLKPKVIVALPTLVMPSHSSSSSSSLPGSSAESASSSAQWLASQPAAAQSRVFVFLERELQRLGVLEADEGPTRSSAQANDTSISQVFDEVTSASVELKTISDTAGRAGRSRAFAPRYKGVSASVAVFVTPVAALVGDNDSVGEGTVARNAWSLWNFTLLHCDVLEAMVREQQQQSAAGIPFTVLRASSSSSLSRELPLQEQQDEHRAANTTTTSAGVADRLRCGSSSSGGNSSGSEAAQSVGAPELVFSCWLYQQLEDEHTPPTASASAAAAVRFERLRC